MVVAVLRTLQDLHNTADFRVHVVAPFLGRLLQAERSLTEYEFLAVLAVTGCRVVDGNDLLMDSELRQLVAIVAVAYVGRLCQEYGPCGHPYPELTLLVGIERKVVRFGGITLEEACQCLAGVHNAKVAGIVDKFLEPVRRRCGGSHETVGNAAEQRQELLEGLSTIAPEHARLIEACYGEV